MKKKKLSLNFLVKLQKNQLKMKKVIFSNWNFMRFFRLGLGLAILIQAVIARDVVFAIAGLVFTAMPVFNIGCCGARGCAVPATKKEASKKDISYEEVV